MVGKEENIFVSRASRSFSRSPSLVVFHKMLESLKTLPKSCSKKGFFLQRKLLKSCAKFCTAVDSINWCAFLYAREFETARTAKKLLKESIFSVLWWFPRVLWPLEALIHFLDMSLDVTACLKALSSAFCQYRSHTTEQNTKDLERQIDVSGSWYKLFVINSLNFWIRWRYRKKVFQKCVEYVILPESWRISCYYGSNFT